MMATLVLAIACCGVYPLLVFGFAQWLFPIQANGSLLKSKNNVVIGSAWIGQNFTQAKYFHPRPSAAGWGYDAANSSGSNAGPTSKKLADTIQDRIQAYRQENHLALSAAVPADAVTASGSGLDPHISLENALAQIPRVAEARHMSVTAVREAVQRNTEAPDLGFLGEQRVHVLKLNRTLDGD